MNSLSKVIVDRTPVTRSALLPNACGDVTRHDFDHAKEEPVLSEKGAVVRGVVFYFKCQVTGLLRAWGCEYTAADIARLRKPVPA